MRLLGWEVYTAFYVPNLTLGVIAVSVLHQAGLGIWGRRSSIA